MTREENIRAILECYFTGFKDVIIDSACERICELEQEPTDEKSVQDMTELEKALLHIKTRADAWAVKVVKDALSQEPESGKWIEQEGWDGDVYYECSVCGEPFCLIDGTPTDNMYNYCPNCGAKMVEPQESEEQTE